MVRTGGDITKQKILETAEKLFAKNGFHATSVNKIATEANVNKALIYYHFKDKNDIVISLFGKILEEISDIDASKSPTPDIGENGVDYRSAIKSEITFLQKKKKILAVLLMETLKSDTDNDFLFECAELVSEQEHPGQKTESQTVYEFFTGFIPLIAFVVLEDRFCDYFKLDKNKAMEHFIDSFLSSHIKHH